jgi:8-oxo-dGTP pyrophosphatase MutT (NUDIX family)
VRIEFTELLREWPEVFRVGRDGVRLDPDLIDCEQRTRAVEAVLQELVGRGVLSRLRGELYAVAPRRGPAELLVDREAASWFGVRAYGQHVNGVVRRHGRLHMWVGRRAADKHNFPRKLDHIAAGGLPHGIGLRENLAKECWEEAAIPESRVRLAHPVGAVSYCHETRSGLKPDTIYCYDLQLPAGFQPRCMDGEVESFELLPIEEVQALVRDTDEFKANCSLVIIDFLIRHGRLGPETEHYLELVQGLHPQLP